MTSARVEELLKQIARLDAGATFKANTLFGNFVRGIKTYEQ
jgi:hypothetical protein